MTAETAEARASLGWVLFFHGNEIYEESASVHATYEGALESLIDEYFTLCESRLDEEGAEEAERARIAALPDDQAREAYIREHWPVSDEDFYIVDGCWIDPKFREVP